MRTIFHDRNADMSLTLSSVISIKIENVVARGDKTISTRDLQHLTLQYIDFSGNTQTGEMIVHEAIADDVAEIFQELYEAQYPIERIELVEEYDCDDEKSMEANNTSCYNYRPIEGSNRISKHGYGLAIDVNPLYNPYVKDTDEGRIVLPTTAEEYVDREADFEHKITEDDLCYKLFTEHGFEWGGNWNSLKDYQHFELPTERVRELYPDY